ncbi:hypothetical protein VTI74DRAFT_2721 [Chaetomium olivicolor]
MYIRTTPSDCPNTTHLTLIPQWQPISTLATPERVNSIMAISGFNSIFSPNTERYRAPSPARNGFIKDGFTLPTLLVFGGLVQGLISLVLPARYALLPAVFFLLRAAVLTIRDLTSPAQYSSRLGVILGRTSAAMPNDNYNPLQSDKASPFGSSPADKGIVVFHLGAQFLHPLGASAPLAKKFISQFMACHEDLLRRAKEYGCLGGTTLHGGEAESKNMILTIYYFRDFEGLNKFAHDPLHRKAWDWYNKDFVKKSRYSHIGIFHEAFCAPAGAWETIYVNMPPVLFGAGSAAVKNEAAGEDEWVRTVVDASSPLWRSSHSRMGKVAGGSG